MELGRGGTLLKEPRIPGHQDALARPRDARGTAPTLPATQRPIVPLSSKPQAFVSKAKPLFLVPYCTAEFRGLFQGKERSRGRPQVLKTELLSLGGTLEVSAPAREGAVCSDTCPLFTCPIPA